MTVMTSVTSTNIAMCGSLWNGILSQPWL